MKLQEKIVYCRKKAGLSQEALAQRLDVSRQAISKWETGEALPELNKILLLANAFGVTTDWLLSEAEPEEEKTAEPPPFEVRPSSNAAWVDALPGMLGRMLRRYGWLFGVYLAVAGAGFTGIGALARYMVRRMFSGSIFSFNGATFPEGAVNTAPFQSPMTNPFSGMAANNPVSIMGTCIMVLGIVMLFAGIILAIALKKRSKE